MKKLMRLYTEYDIYVDSQENNTGFNRIVDFFGIYQYHTTTGYIKDKG